jgi:hypothetical protein
VDDAVLVRRMLAGEERAFDEFFDAFFDRVGSAWKRTSTRSLRRARGQPMTRSGFEYITAWVAYGRPGGFLADFAKRCLCGGSLERRAAVSREGDLARVK